jgi:hypothetical protein
MSIDPVLNAHVTRSFAQLRREAAGNFPAAASLSTALNAAVTPNSKTAYAVNLRPVVAAMFPKAGVDVWMRAVHSFLVSAALTDVSPIWASVSGYYSSHYSVRALAHILGFFQLFGAKQTVQLDMSGSQLLCTFSPKTRQDREHRIYWKVVKSHPSFVNDALFTENDSNGDPSDAGHRDRANYIDFLQNFPTFQPLDRNQVVQRIERISNIEFTAPPIPSASRFPDIDSVQIMAYHRLVKFRDLLDEILGGVNRFWNVNRNPPWAREFIDYQLVDSRLDPSRVASH